MMNGLTQLIIRYADVFLLVFKDIFLLKMYQRVIFKKAVT